MSTPMPRMMMTTTLSAPALTPPYGASAKPAATKPAAKPAAVGARSSARSAIRASLRPPELQPRHYADIADDQFWGKMCELSRQIQDEPHNEQIKADLAALYYDKSYFIGAICAYDTWEDAHTIRHVPSLVNYAMLLVQTDERKTDAYYLASRAFAMDDSKATRRAYAKCCRNVPTAAAATGPSRRAAAARTAVGGGGGEDDADNDGSVVPWYCTKFVKL